MNEKIYKEFEHSSLWVREFKEVRTEIKLFDFTRSLIS
jgi:hypothetical protein